VEAKTRSMRYSMHFVKQSLQVFASIHSCLLPMQKDFCSLTHQDA
jgi:hypothetical protein